MRFHFRVKGFSRKGLVRYLPSIHLQDRVGLLSNFVEVLHCAIHGSGGNGGLGNTLWCKGGSRSSKRSEKNGLHFQIWLKRIINLLLVSISFHYVCLQGTGTRYGRVRLCDLWLFNFEILRGTIHLFRGGEINRFDNSKRRI